jgi:SAM-dependent methyltransferase
MATLSSLAMKPQRKADQLPDMGVLPPPELMKIVGSPSAESYVAVGRNLLGILKRHAGLTANDRVLDVGCGCGRLALPLTAHLTGASASYEGFDVIPELVEWCRSTISPRHPNFRFHRADVANSFYQARAASRAASYRFPYADATFDVTVLTSVFTHMMREDMMNYLGEVARTLKPGGTAVMSFFLHNDESRAMRDLTGREFRWRRYGLRGIRVLDRRHPEGGVSYPEQTVRAALREKGLELQQILFGSWCGRLRAVSGQDIIVARRPLPRRSGRRAAGGARRASEE